MREHNRATREIQVLTLGYDISSPTLIPKLRGKINSLQDLRFAAEVQP